MHRVAQPGAGAQPRIGADAGVGAHHGAVQVRERQHLGAGAQARIAQHAVRAHPHAVGQVHVAFEHAAHVDDDVAPGAQRAAHVQPLGVHHLHAGQHERARGVTLVLALEPGELHLVVDAVGLPGGAGLLGHHRHAIGHGQRHDVGQVVLALGVVVGQATQPAAQQRRGRHQDAGVDLADAALGGVGVLFLDDAGDAAVVAHDAPVAGGVVGLHGEDGEPFGPGGGHQARERVGRGKGHVAIQDQGGRRIVQVRQRLHDGVAGAARGRLQRPVQVGRGQRGAHLLGAVAVHHHQPRRAQRARRIQRVRQQRLAGQPVQHLRERRLHALAHAGRKNHDVQHLCF